MQAEFLHNPSGVGSQSHGASLFLAQNGDLLAVWYAYPGPEDHRNGTIVIARRSLGDSSWSKAIALFSELRSSAGNPLLYLNPTSERLCLLFVLIKGSYWTDAVLYQAFSEDHGVSWSQPEPVWDRKGIMIRHAPVVVNQSGLILPAYNEIENSSVLFSYQNGEWRESHVFEASLIQPVLVAKDSSRLYCFFRPGGDERLIWRAQSKDGGRIWSEVIRTSLPSALSGIAAIESRGRLGVIYNHTNEHCRYPLSFAHSEDNGITWSPPFHIDQVEHEVSYPYFIRSGDGLVYGVYTYNRRMIKFVQFSEEELFNGFSKD